MGILDIFKSDENEWIIPAIDEYLSSVRSEFYEKKGVTFTVNSIDNMISSIVYELKKIREAEYKRFINKFYQVFNERFQSGEISKYNNSVFGNRGYYSFFINLYLLFGGRCRTDKDYDNFERIIDDVFNYDFKYDSIDDFKGDYGYFMNRWYTAKLFCDEPCYKDMPRFRALFKYLLDNYDNDEIVEKVYSKYRVVNEVGNNRYEISYFSRTYSNDYLEEEDIYPIKEALLSDSSLLYESILLYEDRFFYVNERLKEIEDNDAIRKDIFSYIAKIDNEIFLALDYGTDKNHFLECMDVVFDSDSYNEMINKLNLVIEASNLFSKKSQKKALEYLKKLKSREVKDSFNGIEISYPNNTMNRIVKPKKIIDRMKYLYGKIDHSFVSRLDYGHKDASGISDFYVSINDNSKVKAKVM